MDVRGRHGAETGAGEPAGRRLRTGRGGRARGGRRRRAGARWRRSVGTGLALSAAVALAVLGPPPMEATAGPEPAAGPGATAGPEPAVRPGPTGGRQETPGPGPTDDPPVHRTGAGDREAVSLTIYNQDFGLVREVRSVTLSRGLAALQYADVASTIQTETVHIGSPDGGPFRVLEQNYRYDLLSPRKLLEKYVGRTVTVYRRTGEGAAEEPVTAEVLAVNDGTILRIGNEITFDVPGRIAFPEVPDDLIPEPTLVWLLDGDAERRRLEVSYLAGSLSWKADYVLVLDEEDRAGDLAGWVTLVNRSGATWEDARLQLVAGDVQRVSRDRALEMAARAAAAEDGSAPFGEEAFFEYHLYTLERPTTVRNREQKQVTLLEAPGAGVEKRLVFHGATHHYRGRHGRVASDRKVGVFLDLENTEDQGLGMPLPAGVIRVYKEDGSGARQFVGEDRIDHTPRDERVRIKLGEAFDVVGDRRQMEYRVLGSCASESAWKVELRNHKDEAVTVDVMEPVGGDWDLVSSSHAARKLDAHTFRFRVEVPARGSEEVTYRVRVRWC